MTQRHSKYLDIKTEGDCSFMTHIHSNYLDTKTQ